MSQTAQVGPSLHQLSQCNYQEYPFPRLEDTFHGPLCKSTPDLSYTLGHRGVNCSTYFIFGGSRVPGWVCQEGQSEPVHR